MMWAQKIRQRLANHLRAGTTDTAVDAGGTSPTVQRLSVFDTYLNPKRDRVAHQAPHLLIPSALLPPGHAISGEHPNSSVPIFAYRSRGGGVKAYVNRCRHRGSPLIKSAACSNHPAAEPISVGKRIVCPYHSWTYDADNGRLMGVPGEKEGFPCLEKGNYGLLSVAVTESAGGIFVGGEMMQKKGLWAISDVHSELEPIVEESGKRSKGPSALIAYKEWELASNWQLLVETFLEAYHVSSLHSNTLNRVAHSNTMATDTLDGTGDVSLSEFLGQTTNNYFIFPNAAVTVFKRFALYLSIVPKGSNKSLVRAWGVKHSLSGNPNDDSAAEMRDFNAVIAGIEEDWVCSEGIQRGLEGSRMDGGEYACGEDVAFTYGLFESNNIRFLENVGIAADELATALVRAL